MRWEFEDIDDLDREIERIQNMSLQEFTKENREEFQYIYEKIGVPKEKAKQLVESIINFGEDGAERITVDAAMVYPFPVLGPDIYALIYHPENKKAPDDLETFFFKEGTLGVEAYSVENVLRQEGIHIDHQDACLLYKMLERAIESGCVQFMARGPHDAELLERIQQEAGWLKKAFKPLEKIMEEDTEQSYDE